MENRGQALAALVSAEAAKRAEAVVWLARHGGEADAPALLARLRDEHPAVRAYAEQALWLVWSRSGDPALDAMMERGMAAMHAGRHSEAIAIFSEVIQKKPAFAEGWNKRATARYLAGDYQASLADCDQVLKRNPGHFGALSGAGLNHLKLDQPRQALEWFRRALEVNPNMNGIEAEARAIEAQLRKSST